MSKLDVEQIRHRLAQLSELDLLPEWTKQADARHSLFADLPPHMYADPQSRTFPCHTKAATVLNYGLYLFDARQLPQATAVRIETNFQKLASHFGVSNAIRRMKQAFAEAVENAEESQPDEAFAIVRQRSDGSKDRMYPLRNALEVKAAAAWLAENRDALPFQDRHVIATKIAERADKFGASLYPHEMLIEQTSGHGWCSAKEAGEMMLSRLPFLHDAPAEVRKGLQKLASGLVANPAFCQSSPDLVKLAGLVEQIDRNNGLDKLYGSELSRPEAVLFSITYKQASELVDTTCQLLTGSAYNKEQFEKLSYHDIAALFGEDFAEQASTGLRIDGEKMAELAPTLPLGDAKLLDRLMGDSGQTPIFKAASRVGFTRDQLAAFANPRPVVAGTV